MGVAIVAIPSEDDYVWRISSEKIPHMTLLFLGDVTDTSELTNIENFLSHVAETSLRKFGMSVDRRGELGVDKADVLFLREAYEKEISEARMDMLNDSSIRRAYNSVEQFPQWTPHVTLGYPETPAKLDTREYPGFHWINFDKLALWVGDFEGPEFVLKDREEVALAMTNTFDVEDFLEHFGVKGMKWGVRRDQASRAIATGKAHVKKEISERTGSDVVVRTAPGKGVRTVGGNKQPAHEDAIKARSAQQKAKKSTVDSLSNEELQSLVTRLNLENQLKNFSEKEDRSTKGEKVVKDILEKHGDTALSKLGSSKLKKLAPLGKFALGKALPTKK